MKHSPPIEILAERIAERLAALNLSERQASIMATGQPDAIRYIRTRRSMPSTERLFQIARVLEVDPSYLWGETDENDWEGVKDALHLATEMSSGALSTLSQIDDEEKTAPCLSAALGPVQAFPSLDGESQIPVQLTRTSSEIVHILLVPPAIGKRSVIGYQVVGDAMSPLYDNGDFILIDTNRAPGIKDVALVDLGATAGERLSFLALMIGKTKYAISFRQLDGERAFQVPVKRISDIYRVIPYGELVSI